jgi:choice-of-anchor B domain-containing protein
MKILTKTILAFLILLITHSVNAQISPTVNMTFRSKMGFGMSGANICGYADKGKEFALVGHAQGVAVVDVTNPDMPINVQLISGLQSQWREIKVYRNYAYITTEVAGSGLQIVDLAPLLSSGSATLNVITYKGGDSILTNIRNIHALHIDTAKGFVYLFGGNSDIATPSGTTLTNGVGVVLDIKIDPLHPRFVGKSSDNFIQANYIHDGYVRGDTLYSGNIYAGLFSIIDFRDKKNPILINTQRTPTAFNHNTWLSDDSKTLFTTDENQGSYLAAYDVNNPRDIKFLDKIRTVAGNNAIVHNTHIINDFAVTSWYTEGVTIVDAHRPKNLVQVAQYDTYGGSGIGFAGCWGVYPYLPSGNLVCSNYTDTMFVLTPKYVRACYLEGTTTDSLTGLTLSAVLVKINSADMDKKAESNGQGTYATGQVTQGTVSVTYSKTGYKSKTLTGIALASGRVALQNVALVPLGVGVDALNGQKSVYLFPNPTKNCVYLSENTFKDDQLVEILDISGKVVLRSTIGQGRGGFDVQNLINGDYFLRINEGLILKFSKIN